MVEHRSSSGKKIKSSEFKCYLTRAAPRPPIISMNSDPFIERKGTPASVATALARSVLPHPGGPNSSAPFGTCK